MILLLTQLPPASFKALILGYATGIVILIGFALPPLLSLHRVPPLHVLRKDVPKRSASMWTVYLAVVLCMSLLLYWQISPAARPAAVIQIVAFGPGIMVLLLLSTVRSDLLADWQRSLPNNAPNYFVINVQPDQVHAITDYFTSTGVKNTRLYPMVRARLIKINGVLSFAINGSKIDLRISNLRSVNWDTFNVNFFTVVPPGVLEGRRASWVTSVYLNAEQRQQLGKLVRKFSNVTLIDIETIMQRVRGIINCVSLALEFYLPVHPAGRAGGAVCGHPVKPG